MERKRQLTLKNARAFHDRNFPDIVFLIDKNDEEHAVAYMRKGSPTLALDLDCSSTLQLLSTGKKKPTMITMNITSMELYPRRADLALARVT
jgi:hypothetical protein